MNNYYDLYINNYIFFQIKYKFFNIIGIIIILSQLNIYDEYRKKALDPIYLQIKEFESLYSTSFLSSFFYNNELHEIKKFRELNSKRNFIDNKRKINKIDNPEVSIIITVYNQANCFYKALKSVENQILKNIEIIIIDDCSTDNTTEEIEQYLYYDDRIIYYKHESNDGKIKSRSDGIRIATGKYITFIDGDDALSNPNILYNCLSIAKIGNLDVIEFKHAFFKNDNYLHINHNLDNIKYLYNRIIYQPELSFKFFSLDKKDRLGIVNRCIWGKFIRRERMNEVIKYIGLKYTEDYLLDYEDTIMSVALFRISKSFYYMKEIGYYRTLKESDNQYPLLKSKICKPKNITINKELDSIKYLNFLLDISNDTELESKLIYKELFGIHKNKKIPKLITHNYDYVYFILDRINKSRFYNSYQRQKISNLKELLIKKERHKV